MSHLRRALVFLSLSVLVLSAGCRRASQKLEVKPADPAWGQFIAMHTTGIVSRKSKIAVRFAVDMFDKERVGQSAGEFLTTEPSIVGALAISDPREIVLVPEKDLTPGAYYKVRVRGRGLPNVPEKVGDFEFVFQVIQRALDVRVEGVTMDGDEAVISGQVSTSDLEIPEDVEKIFSSRLEGSELKTMWTHDPDGQKHLFSLSGASRKPTPQTLTLAWNGEPVGIEGRGERAVEIPGTQDFKLLEIKPVQDDPRYVSIYFSDELDPKQNLKGLIRSSLRSFTLRTEGSVVKLFPDTPTAGKITITVERGIRSQRGGVLAERREETVAFASQNPQVRFAGSGVILPDNEVLSVSIEAMNVNAVQVTAFQIYEDNVAQFLQSNKLSGETELGRVGRHLWRKTIPLSAPVPDQWQRYHLDVTSLMKKAPGAVFRLSLSVNRSNSIFACSESENAVVVAKEPEPHDHDDISWRDPSGWDGIQEYYYGENRNWKDREDPCKDAYYTYASGVRQSRNFLASNIGLIAKSDATGQVDVVATDIRTAAPSAGVRISLRNFQNQEVAQGSTDGDGYLKIKPNGKPFYLVADRNGEKGYLKLSEGTALPTSHFDTGGETVPAGIKGILYGERGVWRPGDDIHLTFVLEDKNNVIPDDHPATVKLFNPQGQLIDTKTNARPVGDFYRFDLKTDENAPTGTWNAEVVVGGSSFRKSLKVEAVKPNRLKIDLDLGTEEIVKGPTINGTVKAQWLHGASAGGLKTDVLLTLSAGSTRFTRNADHIFDDPTRTVRSERRMIFEGNLDPNGDASFSEEVALEDAPGFLTASFQTRVFEAGGDFSISHKTARFSPYTRYVGLQLPKGDQVRNMLLTDQNHKVSLAVLNAQGEPEANAKVRVTFYKAAWRWWWDQSGEDSPNYYGGEHNQQLSQGDVTTDKDGRASWEFLVKYPDWGRYLVRACNTDGGHCAAQYVYIDWPGWAGRAQEQTGPGANALYFFSDKPSYAVGEKAVLQLPDASEGRGLLTVENGSRILDRRWIEFAKGKTKFEIPITSEMAPNVYACLTLVQPHAGKANDRPIRLYGIVPLKVTDLATVLAPQIEAPEEWQPLKKASVKISESKGRPLTYTLAVVDEGLLGLTSFQTPDLHGHFYRKEALGVRTWDLFDDVVGAYGATLERLLAVGGGDDLGQEDKKAEERRFPPVVRVMGPFRLGKGETQTQTFDLPQYVGQVRVMVVAGERGAYGKSDKGVFVREPISILPTLPRVVGPEEDMVVPVAVFVMDKAVKNVEVSIDTDERFRVVGSRTASADFSQPGDSLVFLKVRSGDRVGPGRISLKAKGGSHETSSDTALTVRAPNVASVNILAKLVEPGKEWTAEVKPHGLPGTNEVALEVSSLPSLNLEKRLHFLIRYPHGCLEQTTSSVFPQLYLPGLVQLSETLKNEIEKNIKSGIDRLRLFQAANGGFYYWPGAWNEGPTDWATNYAGHFLVEAQRLGYGVPSDMRASWVKYQKDRAQSWSSTTRWDTLEQAYRLYTLALAGEAVLPAMNRLKETQNLVGTAEILLAAAYQAAGVPEAAAEVSKASKPEEFAYTLTDPTYGTVLRDQAIYLASLASMKQWDRGKDLALKISERLASEQWLGTHETSYALMALARYYEPESSGKTVRFERTVATNPTRAVTPEKPIFTETLADFPNGGAPVRIKNNGDRRLFVSIAVRGVAKSGAETAAANGLSVEVSYTDRDGKPLDPVRIKQGMDFQATVRVTNKTPVSIHNIAASHLMASGWEIQSPPWGSDGNATPGITYRDVRDDRVLTYINLIPGGSVSWEERLHAAYEGRYYLPGVSVEAMYDATKHARTTGQWVDVARSAK
jgi:uncharacterized protein YfaS (alpha-2-macroglobulin family)